MHKDLVIRTPSLSGSTELLVIAPIKPGFVPALDAVTYTSRAKLLLRALHTGRRNAHEYNLFRAVSDAVERVGVIHTLRLAVLDADDASPAGSILLSVNFDGAYEAYVRTIWQKSSRLLDLIFCNTVDHVCGWDQSCDAWGAWLASRQIETPFYYGAPSMTKGDVTALRMQDRFERRDATSDLLITQSAIPDAEHIAWALIRSDRDPQSGPFAAAPAAALPPGVREGVRQGLQGLAGVYRLADLYMPGTTDGELLHRAAYELLPEFARMWEMNTYAASIEDAAGERLRNALLWFARRPALPTVRERRPLPTAAPSLPERAQAGILRSIEGAKRACVCLVAFDDPASAAAFLREFMPTSEGAAPADQRWFNLALTMEGLRACGVPESTLDQLPIEFRQGMPCRAGLLGDVQGNHPRRWTLPAANWPAAVDDPAAATPTAPAVALEAVHALLHVRAIDITEIDLGLDLKKRFAALGAGVRPLSVQWLRRNFDTSGKNTLDHFGYSDGHSEPGFGPDSATFFPNQVHLGEALVGHANAADAAPVLGDELGPLLKDASYLVVRKLQQDVDAFEAAVASVPLPADLVKAKLMGRRPDGTPLIGGSIGMNDFNYDNDEKGSACPFAAHIRRANPRVSDGVQSGEVKAIPGARPPRLFRRGMSYTDLAPDGRFEKGLFFMAYNASIGQQFEVVQRWLSGGNSSGAPSAAADAICGVAETGRERFVRFEHAGQVVRMRIDGHDELGVEPPQIVRLAWGAYYLAPSLDGVEHLATLADAAARAAATAPPVAWNEVEGWADIQRLLRLPTGANPDAAVAGWKTALEDPESRRTYRTASIWAAVRGHGGLLRTPYGVLVADAGLVDQVLADRGPRYTVSGYQERLTDTIGPIFLGLDAGPEYDRQAAACNAAIEQLSFADGYAKARDYTRDWLTRWTDDAHERARGFGESHWELSIEIREVVESVLARLLEDWFGLSVTGHFLTPAGFDWAFDPQAPARYPGAFYTPSRYTFQPQPTDEVRDAARLHGRQLRDRMTKFLAATDGTITAPVTRAVLDDPGMTLPGGGKDYDLAARTLAGAIMGFVPTTDNNLRRIVDEWLRDQTVWNLRARTTAESLATPTAGRAALADAIARTLMLRPMPEFIWRTVVQPHTLTTTDGAAFDVKPGDRMVLGLISSTHQGLARGRRDVTPVFGGDRWAAKAPRHACPGMPAAMGVIAGVMSAIVDTPLAMRPAAANGYLSFEGPVTASVAAGAFTLKALRAVPPGPAPGAPMLAGAVAAGSKGVLLAWGDSWFHLHHPFTNLDWDLARAFASLGWDTDGFAKHSEEGLTLQEMAGVAPRTGFYRTVQLTRPLAILLDGGGNDVHQTERDPSSPRFGRSPLHDLAAPAGSNPPLNAQAVTDFVHGTLRKHLDTVLANLVEVTGGTIPILVHAYDHPIPDHRGFPPFNIPWLDPVNDRSLYSLAQGTTIMRLLIDELNTMVAQAVAPYAARGARHLDLTGTLAAQPGFGANYKDWWLNELHATQRGYDALALVADRALAAALTPVAVTTP